MIQKLINEEETFTFDDIIEQENERMKTAKSVFGNIKENICTFLQGYIRQPIYSCRTCTPPSGKKLGGICLECSLKCHENHDLEELYTKRNFRCDCGNKNFPNDVPCKLMDCKPEVNDENTYNHNFKMIYCNCKRPYPDPERETQEIVSQCIICEDWIHHEHLGRTTIDTKDVNDENVTKEHDYKIPESFIEVICSNCLVKKPLLTCYRGVEVGHREFSLNKDKSVCVLQSLINLELSKENICHENDENETRKVIKTLSSEHTSSKMTCMDEKSNENGILLGEKTNVIDPKEDKVINIDIKVKNEESDLIVKTTNNNRYRKEDLDYSPIFFSSGKWRKSLCRCDECLLIYKKLNIQFLLDDKDTLDFYENANLNDTNNNNINTNEDMMERAFQSVIPHEKKVEMANGYRFMANHLKEFLDHFAKSQKTVKASDINDFFDNLKRKNPMKEQDNDLIIENKRSKY